MFESFLKLRDANTELNNEGDCAARLLAIKRLQKQLSKEKEDSVSPLKSQLTEAQLSYHSQESWCAEQETALKARIVEFFHVAEQKKIDCLKKAEIAFENKDLAAVRHFTVEAAESELKLPAGVSLRQSLDFAITDPAAVPRQFLDISTKRIRELLYLNRENTRIDGVNIFHKLTIAAGV